MHRAALFILLVFCAPAAGQTNFSENEPFSPVLARDGLIVEGGHIGGNLSDGSSYIAAPRRLPKFDSVVLPGAANTQESLADCSRSCAAFSGCNIFVYCSAGGGACPDAASASTIPERGCELVVQPETLPNRTFPFIAVPGEKMPFVTSGAPILNPEVQTSLPLPGFSQLFAASFYSLYNFNCTGSLQDGACIKKGAPADLAGECAASPQCKIMVWYPEGRSDLGTNVIIFKGGEGVTVDQSLANLNQRSVTFFDLGDFTGVPAPPAKDDGGLAAGAVAGIAVGCTVAGALLVLLAQAVRRRRGPKSQENPDLVLGKPDEENPVRAHSPLLVQTAAAASLRRTSTSLSRDSDSATVSVVRTSAPAPRTPLSPFLTLAPMVSGASAPTYGRSSLDYNSPLVFPSSTHGKGSSIEGPPQSVRSEHGRGVSIVESSEDGGGSGGSQQKTVKVQELGQRLERAATAAGVMEAVKGANWAHYSIDFDNIQWLQHPDGSLLELGVGAFSKVYKVTLDGTQAVAAKVLTLEDRKAERVFLREVTTLFHLRHANCVQFFGVCIHNQKGILLMELMEGGSLYANLALRSMDGNRVVGWYAEGKRIASGIAQALHYLHSLRLVHLDLKSANVMLTRDFTPKLADVGFTRVWASLDMSTNDSRIGTFAYMAPELLLGGSMTSAVDMFSFGVLLRELCTGEIASRGRTRLPIVPDECPQAVLDIIIKCLETEPEDRPAAKDAYAMLINCSR